MAEVLLTVREYAALFRRHEQTIWRRIRRGTFTKFPIERDGRTILIRVPATRVETLRRQQTPKTTR